jgi:uncharacterized iron-regulated membrane protein
MGVVVAMLSVTGVIIWWRKRASRVVTAGRRAAEAGGSLGEYMPEIGMY